MTNLAALLDNLRRPKILIRAARSGVNGFRRERDLRRIFRGTKVDVKRNTIVHLMAAEQQMEEFRTEGNANYNVQRHINLLIAIMAEARHFSELVNATPAFETKCLRLAA